MDSDEEEAPAKALLRRMDRYRQAIFDCDGVLVDTNGVKEANIRAAAGAWCDPETTSRFVEYFVRNNGLPREEKIAHFFADEVLQEAILARYNELNRTSVPLVAPAPATVAFVGSLVQRRLPLYVLSGGDEPEVRMLLENAGLAPLFHDIMGGPRSKMDHVGRLQLSGATCYFGDSLYDYEVASRFGLDFVFLSRYTQFPEWESFFAGKPEVTVVDDFASLNLADL
jgi:phosphoglycolate phosphatase-like HAD superfamily hydrolase